MPAEAANITISRYEKDGNGNLIKTVFGELAAFPGSFNMNTHELT